MPAAERCAFKASRAAIAGDAEGELVPDVTVVTVGEGQDEFRVRQLLILAFEAAAVRLARLGRRQAARKDDECSSSRCVRAACASLMRRNFNRSKAH